MPLPASFASKAGSVGEECVVRITMVPSPVRSMIACMSELLDDVRQPAIARMTK
jgi:hypothetical protein